MVKPILKWAGGKTQILHEIRSHLPDEFNSYHEPFFGGGALFFDMQPSNGTINDKNSRLMNFYRQIRDNPDGFIEECKELQRDLDTLDTEEAVEEYYYERRDEFNSLRQHGLCENEVREAVLLLFLNRTCFNGLYRENQSGEFNVPFGDNTDPDIVREVWINEASKVLQGTDIRNQDFGYIEHAVEEDDLVYMDPPYKPASETANFAEYVAGGFGEKEQRRLRDLAIDLDKRGVYVTLSNSLAARNIWEEDDVPEGAFEIQELEALRSINSNGADRTGAKEVIITNVPKAMRRGTLSSFKNAENEA